MRRRRREPKMITVRPKRIAVKNLAAPAHLNAPKDDRLVALELGLIQGTVSAVGATVPLASLRVHHPLTLHRVRASLREEPSLRAAIAQRVFDPAPILPRPRAGYADAITPARPLDRAATSSANPSASAPLRVKLSQHGVGLSAGVTGARFGVDAGGHPYVHAGRHGLYYRKRWPIPSSPPRDPLALPGGPPSSDTHRHVGWGWVLVLLVLIGLVWRW